MIFLVLVARTASSLALLRGDLTHQAESFPLPSYIPRVYRPHVTDHDIQLLIRELTEADRLPSGAKLGTALHQRFGSRGGVKRIYRLLPNAHAARNSPPDCGPS